MHQWILFAVLTFVFQNGLELYQQALVQENAAGNLEAAIQLYQDAVRHAAGNRALAAQALLGAARCYEKLGVARAYELYEEIGRNYADQQQAAVARERAVALQRTLRESRKGGELEGNSRWLEGTASWNPRQDKLIHVGQGVFWLGQPQFSPTRPITITGTLSSAEWVNPSVKLSIEVKAANGMITVYRVFGANPRRLIESGITKDLVKLGDLLTVDGFLGEAPLMIGNATITLQDGRKVSRLVHQRSIGSAHALRKTVGVVLDVLDCP